MNQKHPGLNQLTLAQEQEIAKDATTLLITVCVLNRWSMQDIANFYDLEETAIIQKLALLDRLGIIELLPNSRIKLKVAANFHWHTGGPIANFFKRTIERELFDADFSEPPNQLFILNGMFSPQSAQALGRKLEKLAHEFNQLNDADAGLEINARNGVTLVLAMRDWQYNAFKPFLRKKAAHKARR